MTPETPTPDYGEPWKPRTEGSRTVIINPGATGADFDLPIHAARAFSCVNACAGMADPAAEIAAMREAISEAYAALDACSHNLHSAYGKLSDNADAALAKLQPFIKP